MCYGDIIFQSHYGKIHIFPLCYQIIFSEVGYEIPDKYCTPCIAQQKNYWWINIRDKII